MTQPFKERTNQNMFLKIRGHEVLYSYYVTFWKDDIHFSTLFWWCICCICLVFFVTSCFLRVWHDSIAQAEIFVEMASLTWFFAMSFGSIEMCDLNTNTLSWYENHGQLLHVFSHTHSQTRSNHRVTIVEWGNTEMPYCPCIKSLPQVSRHPHDWSLKHSSALIHVFSIQNS